MAVGLIPHRLLRSLATIFGYLAAAPVAVVARPASRRSLIEQFKVPPAQTDWFRSFVPGDRLHTRRCCGWPVSEIVGTDISMPDRGRRDARRVRVVLLAVLMVVVFDRIIPAGRDRRSGPARDCVRFCRAGQAV